MGEDNRVHAGHRSRMKDKFRRLGAGAFDTYELLEMLLYHVIPHRDTNPIAHRLIARFSSLEGVFAATAAALCEVEGVKEKTAAFLASVLRGAAILAEPADPAADRFDEYEKNGAFVAAQFSARTTPGILMILLDNRLECIRCEWVDASDFDSASVKTPMFVRPALRYGAAAVILAHEHPHGPLSPSVGDMATANMVSAALQTAGVDLIEHYIVCGSRFYGFHSHARYALNAKATEKDAGQGQMPSTDRSQESARRTARLAAYLEPPFGARAERIAARLIERFGSIPRVFGADGNDIAAVEGVGESVAFYIKLTVAIHSRRHADGFAFGVPHTTDEIIRYFFALFSGESVENVYMMLLDASRRVVACERVSVGATNAAQYTPRRLLEIAMRYDAAYAILAHNHPGGFSRPSAADIASTNGMIEAFDAAGVRLLDHYVFGAASYDSVMHRNTSVLSDPLVRGAQNDPDLP